MKKAIVALALAAVASTASATVAGSKHDLSSGGPFASLNGQLSSCQFCHAPHNVNTTVSGTPLWNRNSNGAGRFTMYTSNTLRGTIATAAAGPNANSMTCLSCHDGVSDLGATYTGSPGFAAPVYMTNAAFSSGSGANVVGTDLRNDHPVSVRYGAYGTGAGQPYKDTTSVLGSGLRLYGTAGTETVECGSCHNPHDNTTNPPFLRYAKTGICTQCHQY